MERGQALILVLLGAVLAGSSALEVAGAHAVPGVAPPLAFGLLAAVRGHSPPLPAPRPPLPPARGALPSPPRAVSAVGSRAPPTSARRCRGAAIRLCMSGGGGDLAPETPLVKFVAFLTSLFPFWVLGYVRSQGWRGVCVACGEVTLVFGRHAARARWGLCGQRRSGGSRASSSPFRWRSRCSSWA